MKMQLSMYDVAYWQDRSKGITMHVVAWGLTIRGPQKGWLFSRFSIKRIWCKYVLSALPVQDYIQVKSHPITCLERPWGLQEFEATRFQDSRHTNVASLSAVHAGRLYSPGNISAIHFCYRHMKARVELCSFSSFWVSVSCRRINFPFLEHQTWIKIIQKLIGWGRLYKKYNWAKILLTNGR
jgi:hypothetical protein